MRRTIVLLAGLIMVSMGGCATSVPRTITKAEARSLPEPVVTRRVMAQLAELVTGPPGARRDRPVNPLTDMTFLARPRATGVRGLCQIDLLTVTFRLPASGPVDADTPVSAEGFRSSSHFHFMTPPTANYFDMRADEAANEDVACEKTDLYDSHYFLADDADIATNGFLVARRVMDAVAGGTPDFSLTCDLFPVEVGRDCIAVLRELAADPIAQIAQCEAARTEMPGAHCFRVEVADRSLRIVASPISYGPNVRPALTVLHVHMDSLIVLVHERID